MNAELSVLIDKLIDQQLSHVEVIDWGCPILSFGNLKESKVATLGINPSNREFVDNNGNELKGDNRRFHTLNSLGISCWSEIEDEHLDLILEVCEDYFFRNPYDAWFKKLDYIISGTAMSYYFPSGEACHLDLVPYATECKWTELTPTQRTSLIEISGDTLGLLLKKSPVELLILNGQSVVENFERIAEIEFKKRRMPAWTLPRKINGGITGYSYIGDVNNIGGHKLKNTIRVLGYNHNIQSSFGVTNEVQTAIRNWVSRQAAEIFE